MDSSIEFLRQELERLFELEAIVRLSSDLLGIDLKEVESTKGKGALARLLVKRCADENALQALSDAILLSSSDADSRLRELSYNGYNSEIQPGTEIGTVRVLRKIGEGGIGTVYLAESLAQEGTEPVQIALKVFRPEVSHDKSAVNRYKTATRIMQSIDSGGVAAVYDVGELEDARPWVAEEHIAGETFAERVKKNGSLHFKEAKPIFSAILDALQSIHERGLIHGNLKTENVFLIDYGKDSDENPSEPTAVLVDGCVNRLALPTKTSAGASGLYSVLGTAKSLAPEQARGVDFDQRSDIYAMGVLMYEVLTGRPPFEADSAIDTIAQHLSSSPEKPSIRSRQGWVSEEIDDLVVKALSKDPAERFQSAIEMLAALDRIGDPSRKVVILDLDLFEQQKAALFANPGNEEASNAIEQMARETEQYQEAVSAYEEIAESTDDGIAQLALYLRVARILETDVRDDRRAEAAYRRVLELDPDNQSAIDGLESCLRHNGDFDGLLEVLLDKLERTTISEERVAVLREVASIYERQHRDTANAFTAWVQALAEQPRDERIVKEILRLAGPAPERWGEAIDTLATVAQELIAKLFPDEAGEQERAERKLMELQTRLEQAKQARADAERMLEIEAQQLAYIEAQYGQATTDAEELTRLADQYSDLARSAHDESERSIEAFEKVSEQEGEELLDESRRDEVERLGKEAERTVVAADEADALAQSTADQASSAWERAQELEIDISEAKDLYAAANEALREARANEEEAAQSLIDAGDGEPDESQLAEERERQKQDLLQVCVLMGRWYLEKFNDPEQALPCFTQALSIDPVYEPAFDGALEVYRSSQSWNELAQVLLQFAEQTQNPLKARDCRAEAADIIALNDPQTALRHYQMVLDQDPSHEAAYKSVHELLVGQNDWPAVITLLERRLGFLEGTDYIDSLCELAEIQEYRIGNISAATEKYEAVLKKEPGNMTALKGLERLYAQQNKIEQLLANLQGQLEIVATPKQRILLLERIGLIQEEEFVDHTAAATSFESIIQIDPAHEGANSALARIYRALGRYEEVIETFDRHARSTDDERQKIALYLQSIRVLMTELSAPDRAMVVCERVLAIDDQQPEALELLARLRSEVGDVPAAIEALEALAEREENRKKQAEFYWRAAKLLEDSGDGEAAVIRYKKALDCDPSAVDAATALRRIYSERGDHNATVEMLRKELSTVEGDLERANLVTELGFVYYRHFDDMEQAIDLFQEALTLDATCTQASVGLGEISYQTGNFDEATQYFESILNRIDSLPAAEASKLCLLAGECFLKIGDTERARDIFKRAREVSRDDLEINEKLAVLVMELGDASEAERLYDRILRKFGEDIPESKKQELTVALGEAQLSAKHVKRAIDTFRTAYEFSPDSPEILEALTRAYDAASEWQEMISILQLRSRLSTSKDESFKLLVQIGDVFLEKMQDRRAAVQTYSAALEIDPNNRNLLTKLMAVYSDTKDWPRLIEVILRIASMVDDVTQLAKYHRTVATIAHHELGRYDEAANYYEESLLNEPQNEVAFAGLVECLTQNQDWDRLVSAYQSRILSKTENASNEEIAALLDACGEILQHRLGRLEEAIQVYEQAQAFDPDNRARKEKLNQIYTKEPKRFFKQSIQINRDLLQSDPRRIDSYKAMRKTYTKVKKPDESWCVCQVLHLLNMCDPDEEKFFQKYRLQQLPRIKIPIGEELWRNFIIHPTQPENLTAIFAAITPAVVVSQSQSLATFGVNPEYQTDPANDATVIGRMLDYVSKSAQLAMPNVYHRTDDAGGLSFIFTSPPAIGIGEGARAGGPQQALAFVAARHLSYFRNGHYLRQLVPTGTGLRAWLIAAIRMVSPKFPAPPNLESQIKEYGSALDRHLIGPQRDILRSMTRNLLETAPELDMKRWLTGVDLTADRVGFILANDLKLSSAVIEASPEDTATVPRKERIDELLRYSVSDEYFELRRLIGIALGQ